MKKSFSLIICVIMLFVFVCGCGKDSKKTSSDSSATNGSVGSSLVSSDAPSKDTTSRLTDDQIATTQHLGNWANKIEEVKTASDGKFTFLVQTDTHHYDTSIAYEGKNVAAFSNFVDLDFAANLGDLTRGYSVDEIDNPENMRACMADIVQRTLNRAKCPVFMTVGNHDTNKLWCEKWADHTAQIMPSEHVEMVFSPLKQHNGDAMVTGGNGSYYYMDFNDDKIRVIMLNTVDDEYDGTKYSNIFKISDEQVKWFKEEALNTTNAVIVMMHTALFQDFPDNDNSVVNSGLILSSVEEFVANGGQFIAYMYGHSHDQYLVIDDNGRLHISFFKGGKYGEVVMIDTNLKSISTIGLGGIKDREFRYD